MAGFGLIDKLKGKQSPMEQERQEHLDENITNNAESNASTQQDNKENLSNKGKKSIEILIDKFNKKTFKSLGGFSMFEKVNDSRSLFLLERTIHKNIIFVAFFFFCTTILCLILIMFLLPLKEKEPYLVAFSDATQNFVTIERADKTISSNEALIRSLIGAYILNRETINHIDDKKRFDMVKDQSSPKVWNMFESLMAQEKSIYTNENLVREVEIINVAKWKNGYSNVDVVIRLKNIGTMSLESEKRYRIIIVYKFINQKITFDNIPKNPTGFQVIDYAITQLAVIKDLDDKNKAKNPTKSKIKDDVRQGHIPITTTQDDYTYPSQTTNQINSINGYQQPSVPTQNYNQMPQQYQQNSGMPNNPQGNPSGINPFE